MLHLTKSKFLFFADINEISEKIWNDLHVFNPYLNHKYLRALEKHNRNLVFYYIVLLDDEETAVALASLQLLKLNSNAIKDNYLFLFRPIIKFSKLLQLIRNKNEINILVCGNSFISGTTGFLINPDYLSDDVFNQLLIAIPKLIKRNKFLKKTIDVIIFKDFDKKSKIKKEILKKHKYYPFVIEPNMVLPIRSNWNFFNDYLASFKTKFRVKAKRALTLSESLKVVEFTKENFVKYAENIDKLYHSVAKKSSFNLINFNIKTYEEFLILFGKNYILQGYFLEEKMVGFISGLIQNKSLDTHFVGIDYDYNKSHAIYQRMLYDYVKIAIDQQLKIVNFGRTASEIKSSIGAVSKELSIYIRHNKTIPNQLLKFVLKNLKPIPTKQKNPFKKVAE